MPSPSGRKCAIKFRRKIYVGPHHKDAIDLAFAGMTDLSVSNISDRIADGKEELIFGYAHENGSDFVISDSQEGRKIMYGFEARYPEDFEEEKTSTSQNSS